MKIISMIMLCFKFKVSSSLSSSFYEGIWYIFTLYIIFFPQELQLVRSVLRVSENPEHRWPWRLSILLELPPWVSFNELKLLMWKGVGGGGCVMCSNYHRIKEGCFVYNELRTWDRMDEVMFVVCFFVAVSHPLVYSIFLTPHLPQTLLWVFPVSKRLSTHPRTSALPSWLWSWIPLQIRNMPGSSRWGSKKHCSDRYEWRWGGRDSQSSFYHLMYNNLTILQLS